MLTAQNVTGKVLRVIRHGHTKYGNPTMSAVVELTHIEGVPVEGTPELRTATIRVQNDAGLVYGIENAEYREQPHTFVLTRAGRISHVAPCKVCGSRNLSHAQYCPRGAVAS